jgi:hypothetical protein
MAKCLRLLRTARTRLLKHRCATSAIATLALARLRVRRKQQRIAELA